MKTTPQKTRTEIIYQWQGYHHFTNAEMGKKMHKSTATWGRWLADGFSSVNLDQLLRIIDILAIPEADAIKLLTAGSRSIEKSRARQ